MDIQKLYQIIKGEEPYRVKQIEKALFKDNINSWTDLTVLPIKFRNLLEEEAPIFFNANIIKSSTGSSVKALIKLKDGLIIESVLLLHNINGINSNDRLNIKTDELDELFFKKKTDKDNSYVKNNILKKESRLRATVCVSSQAGCPIGCAFCRTAKIGFKRNLDFYEIIEQVLFFQYYLKKINQKSEEFEKGSTSKTLKKTIVIKKPQKITNVVFMGMGEPFLNFENVINAIKILNDKDKFQIGSRKISISTSGIPEMIKKLAYEELQVNLAVSLNAAEDSLRSRLMPINKKYPIRSILDAVRFYLDKTNRRVMFEYVLIKNVNDSLSHAKSLINLLKGKPIENKLCFVNVIPYNGFLKTQDLILQAPDYNQVKMFKKVLIQEGINVTQRYKFGEDINGACGQLVYSGS